MSAQIATLYSDKDKNNAIFPRTKVSAISDESGIALSEMVLYHGDGIDSERAMLDADLLQGHDASYFTSSSDFDTKVEELNTAIEELNTAIANAGKFYGIDTSTVLTSQDGNVGSGGRSYTATQDCYVFVYNNHGGNAGSIYINGVYVMTLHQSTCSLILKQGQTITVYHGDGGNQIIKLRAFGLLGN